MANLATDKIIGRTTAGTGVPEALSIHDVLNLAGTPSDNHILKYDSTSSQWVPEVDVDTDTVYTHPNHTGEVTSTNDGATVIASDVVDEDNLKISNSAVNGYFLSAQSGDSGGLTWAVPTDTNTVYAHPDHSGDVVSTADGATVIQEDAVDIAMLSASGTASSTTFLRGDNSWVTPTDTNTVYTHPHHSGDVVSVNDGGTTIQPDAVTYAKMQNVTASDRVLGRDSSGAGVIEEISPTDLRTMLNVADGAEANNGVAMAIALG